MNTLIGLCFVVSSAVGSNGKIYTDWILKTVDTTKQNPEIYITEQYIAKVKSPNYTHIYKTSIGFWEFTDTHTLLTNVPCPNYIK